MSENKLPNSIDKHVGRRVRWRRRELNFSQEKLGELLGLTFQQIQKYEKGVNRISAGRLFEMSRVLETTIGYFFMGVEEMDEAMNRSFAESDKDQALTGLIDADAVDLVVAFQSIPDPKLRQSILTMVRNSAEAFADNESNA
ncbi:helix-turn-helix domain-containing protein [Hirschia baltica]|uniref:Transcriptional regulator, XRE family n=1 Tax=Hirschia baltica (strain ATCC 49814 / DSM 5838 / IFAM 1418) TaxID=582402 RepID=C6XIE3_HIRBI|nr:helix-turn-helix transcriptional regulator [Hirschia baltica]ACT60750.1 transcriptional regulator, XRE family [Hirschia baltica ATCC 49814]